MINPLITQMVEQSSLFPEHPADAAARRDAAILLLLSGHVGGPRQMPLGQDEKNVLRCIRYQRGRAHAVSISAIREKTGLNPRQIKSAVRSLRLNFSLAIGSSKHAGDGGYYLIVDKEDLDSFIATALDQVKAEIEVVRAVGGRQAALDLVGQLSLEVQS